MAEGFFGLIGLAFEEWSTGDIQKFAAAKDEIKRNPILQDGLDAAERLIAKLKSPPVATEEQIHQTLVNNGVQPDTATMVIEQVKSANPAPEGPAENPQL